MFCFFYFSVCNLRAQPVRVYTSIACVLWLKRCRTLKHQDFRFKSLFEKKKKNLNNRVRVRTPFPSWLYVIFGYYIQHVLHLIDLWWPKVLSVEIKSICSDYEVSLRSDFPKQFSNQDQLIQGRFYPLWFCFHHWFGLRRPVLFLFNLIY